MKLFSLSDRPRRAAAALCLAGMVFSALLFAFFAVRTEQQAAAAADELAQTVLRFRVKADADTAEAQALKLRVRDAVLAYVQPLLQDVRDRGEAEQILAGCLPEIEAAAARVTAGFGDGEAVHASLGDDFFPVRTYGSVTFPAGVYRSLTVTVGSGRGHNWWCVMYPTLCFSDSLSTDIYPDSEERLTNLLSEEARDVLVDDETPDSIAADSAENSEADSAPRIRFRIFTFFNRFLP